MGDFKYVYKIATTGKSEQIYLEDFDVTIVHPGTIDLFENHGYLDIAASVELASFIRDGHLEIVEDESSFTNYLRTGGKNIDTSGRSDMRIWEYLKDSGFNYSISDILQTDVTLLGMNQKPWELIKGRRKRRRYLNTLGKEVLSFIYEYITSPDGQVKSLSRYIEYYNNAGGVSKTKELSSNFEGTKLITLNREVRQNQIDSLRGRGKGMRDTAETLAEPIKSQYLLVADNVDFLWLHYKNSLEEYVNVNSGSFRAAVEGETNQSVLDILSIIGDPEGNTVKEIILAEIN